MPFQSPIFVSPVEPPGGAPPVVAPVVYQKTGFGLTSLSAGAARLKERDVTGAGVAKLYAAGPSGGLRNKTGVGVAKLLWPKTWGRK